MSYQRGDVVWGPDPFKTGESPRPWLILNNDTHPFGGEADTDGENVVHRTEEHPSSVLLPFVDTPKGRSLPGEPECGVPDGYGCVDISL